jgi:hypothetical protein
MHTTNYQDTMIEVAEDCPSQVGMAPPLNGDQPTVAWLHYALIHDHPYQHTSDDVIFLTQAQRTGITEADLDAARERFFSKGQPCLRFSPLGKRYGWGVHSDSQGRVAIYAVESVEYNRLRVDPAVHHLRAMRSARQ